MIEYFQTNRKSACCLCGAVGSLTGEHKFKRSAIADLFGKEPMSMGSFAGSGSRLVDVQGPKSKKFHFTAKLCPACNGARTQVADKEFDRFNKLCISLVASGEDPSRAFEDNRYTYGSSAYLNVFRYFAKILCCHVAEIGGPRPIGLAKFAIGESERNPIFLRIGLDQIHSSLSAAIPNLQFASHGGLTVSLTRASMIPNSFSSSITFGQVRYEFWIELLPQAQLSLLRNHRSFLSVCRKAAKK